MSIEGDGSTPCNSGEGARDGSLMAGGHRRRWATGRWATGRWVTAEVGDGEVGRRADLKGKERVALIINVSIASSISELMVYRNR